MSKEPAKKKTKDRFRVLDDEQIESLMRYYKLDTSEALFKHLRSYGFPKDEKDVHFES